MPSQQPSGSKSSTPSPISSIQSGPMSAGLIGVNTPQKDTSVEYACQFSVCLMFVGIPVLILGFIFLSILQPLGITFLFIGAVTSVSGTFLSIAVAIYSLCNQKTLRKYSPTTNPSDNNNLQSDVTSGVSITTLDVSTLGEHETGDDLYHQFGQYQDDYEYYLNSSGTTKQLALSATQQTSPLSHISAHIDAPESPRKAYSASKNRYKKTAKRITSGRNSAKSSSTMELTARESFDDDSSHDESLNMAEVELDHDKMLSLNSMNAFSYHQNGQPKYQNMNNAAFDHTTVEY